MHDFSKEPVHPNITLVSVELSLDLLSKVLNLSLVDEKKTWLKENYRDPTKYGQSNFPAEISQ